MRRLLQRLAILCAALAFASPALPQTGGFNWPAGFHAPDTDRAGADFLGFDLPRNATDGANLCALACAQNGQCRAYTYVKPGIQGPNARCYLKSSAPLATFNTCCVSGARTGDQLAVLPAAPNPFVSEATRQRVGYAKYPASGVVPVAVVVFDFGAGFPVDGTGVPFDSDYFEMLNFAPPAQDLAELRSSQSIRLPNGVMLPGNRRTSQHSLSSFYWEASNHKLLLVPAGPVIGPIRLAPAPAGDANYTQRKAAEQIVSAYGDRLRLFDKNGDGRLTPTEFAIMVYDNGSEFLAATRPIEWPNCSRPENSPVELCIMVGLHGYRSTTQNPAHEFMHMLGIGYDTYGWNFQSGGGDCWGGGATIMSCTAFAADDDNRRLTVDFDAYHRMAFGWATPQLLRIGNAGVFKLTAAQSLEDRPLVLYKADWSEIFVIEYRDGTLGGHDAGFFRGSNTSPPKGVMFWYAQLDANGLYHKPSGIGPGRDGIMQTQLLNDDVGFYSNSPTGKRMLTQIRPGPNTLLESKRLGDDALGTTAMIMPARNPRTVWTSAGTNPAMPVNMTNVRLWDWDGNQLPVRIEIRPHPSERDAVLLFVYAEP